MTIVTPSSSAPSKAFDICLISGIFFNFACVTAQYHWPRNAYPTPYPTQYPTSYPSQPGPYPSPGYPAPRQDSIISSDVIKVTSPGFRGEYPSQDPYRYFGGYGSGSTYFPRPSPGYSSSYPQPMTRNDPYRPPTGYAQPTVYPGYGSSGYPSQQSPRGYSYPTNYPGYTNPSPPRPYQPYPSPYPSYQQPYPSYPSYPQPWQRPSDPWNNFDRRQGTTPYPPPYPGQPQYPRRPSSAQAQLKGEKSGGEVHFVQHDNRYVAITGRLVGLTPGAHGFHIHELSSNNSCENIGNHFNPLNAASHGGKSEWVRHAGDLGNVFADHDGVAYFDITDSLISLHGPNSIAGKTLVVTETADDLGKGHNDLSKVNGNSGKPIACGTIMLTQPAF